MVSAKATNRVCSWLLRRNSKNSFNRMTRTLDPLQIVCFSTFFHTQLMEGEVEHGIRNAATSAKKKITNIFKTSMIAIPINFEHWHWAICVILNPGHIQREQTPGLEACILHFDSGGGNIGKASLSRIKQWLNYEWKSQHPETPSQVQMFRSETFPVYQPTGAFFALHAIVCPFLNCHTGS